MTTDTSNYIELANKAIGLLKHSKYSKEELRQNIVPESMLGYRVYGCDRPENAEQTKLCIALIRDNDKTLFLYREDSPVLEQALSEISDSSLTDRFIRISGSNIYSYLLLLDFYIFISDIDCRFIAATLDLHILMPFTDVSDDSLEDMVVKFHNRCPDKDNYSDPYACYADLMEFETGYQSILKANAHLRGAEKNAFIYGNLFLNNSRYEQKLKALKNDHFKQLLNYEVFNTKSKSDETASYSKSFLNAVL